MKKVKPIDGVHGKENNKESQEHLEANAQKFGEKCQKVYDILQSGVRLTVLSAMTTYHISSLPRRIKDLRDMWGVTTIVDEWIEDKDGNNYIKQWYMKGTAPATTPDPKKQKKSQPKIQANPLFGGIQ